MQTIKTNLNQQHIWMGNVSKVPVNTDSIEAMTAEKDHMVSGIFKNLECPGQPGYVCCRIYKGQPIFQKWFDDGEETVIPLSVARHINQNTQYPIHSYLLDEKGNYIKGTGVMKQRFQFVSKDYY